MDRADEVTLREHLEARCDERTKQYFAALHSTEQKLDSIERILDTKLKVIDADMRILREARAELQGKASQSATNAAAILAVLSLLVSVFMALLRQ